MHKIARVFLYFAAACLIGTLPGCATTELHAKPGTQTTLILIRHTERTMVTKVLTAEGQERAQALVNAVSGMDIKAIYSPDMVRNKDTVRPLVASLGIPITLVSDDFIKTFPETVLARHPDETVLWVGNKGNLEEIYLRLGGEGEPPVNYGDLFVVTISDHGETTVEKRHFGEKIF